MMLILFLATELTSIVTSLALVPPSDASDLSLKYLGSLGKEIVHFNGSPLCISKPTTADARNRVLNLLAHKMCTRTRFEDFPTPRFGTYQLHDSRNQRLETKDVYCRLKRNRYEITCTLLNNQRTCENFIEVKCKSCHQEDTVSRFNDVTLRNPLYPHLVPGWVCTYDINMEDQNSQHKTMMALKILNLSLPPADYTVTPGRPQCVESYIQILQGWSSNTLSVLATLCDEHDGPLYYNVTKPHVQIRFVSGNLFYPRLTGFSIIVSAHHVGYNVSEKSWKYFVPVVIVIFFLVVFFVGVIYCFIIICSENRNKSRRGSWQSSPTHPLEVRHPVSRSNRQLNPENPYIMDNTTRPRTSAENHNPGTSTNSLPGSARSRIQQRSLPTPPISISARWDTETRTSRPQQLQYNSGLHAANMSSRDDEDIYVSVDWNDQSGIYINRTNPSPNCLNRTSLSANSINRTSPLANAMNRTGPSANCMNRTSQSGNFMNRTSQSGNFMNRTSQSADYNSMNRTNQLENIMNRSNQSGNYMNLGNSLNRTNQSNQSFISRMFSSKMYRPSPKNRNYEDLTGSPESGIYTSLSTPQVPRRPSWTFEQEILDQSEIVEAPTPPVYMTVIKSPDNKLNKPVEDEFGTTGGVETGGYVENTSQREADKSEIDKDEVVSQYIAERDMIQALQDEHIYLQTLARGMCKDKVPQSTKGVKDECKDVGDVEDTPRTPIMPASKDDLDEDFRSKARNYKCVLSEMKKKVRNSCRSVSVSGGFTFWEIDQEDLLKEKEDDVFDA